jgi:hypothetical protein
MHIIYVEFWGKCINYDGVTLEVNMMKEMGFDVAISSLNKLCDVLLAGAQTLG